MILVERSQKERQGLPFWSRNVAGAGVALTALIGLGRLAEAALLSFDAPPVHLDAALLGLASFAAIFAGGLIATKLSEDDAAHPILSAAVVWASTASVLMFL